MGIRIGPAGVGPTATAEKVLQRYNIVGISACEVQFSHQIYMNMKDAEKVGKSAKFFDIQLSIHAPFYINLASGEKAKREASKNRIIKSCEIGEKMGAVAVVFHPGFYGKDKEETYNMIKEEILEIMKVIEENKWKIKIAAETTGKINVFGSLEETARLVDETGCSFCIDFAHVLAREKSIDFGKIEKLFPQKVWHCHFSGIKYGEKGETSHVWTTKDEWKNLFKNLPKDKEITVINESPKTVEDSIDGVEISKGYFKRH